MAVPLRRWSPPPARARVRSHVADLCPLCAADLGGPGGATRRLSWIDGHPGLLWGCPECRGRWRATPEPGRRRAVAPVPPPG